MRLRGNLFEKSLRLSTRNTKESVFNKLIFPLNSFSSQHLGKHWLSFENLSNDLRYIIIMYVLLLPLLQLIVANQQF